MFTARQESTSSGLLQKVRILESGKFFGEEANIAYFFQLDESRAIYHLVLKMGGSFEIMDALKNPKKIEYLNSPINPCIGP
jgi:hypothetical protein